MHMVPGFDHAAVMMLGWLFGILLLFFLIWAIARVTGSPRVGPREESPEAILKRRYARGEVDREEYERRLSDLRK
jgi:putative membrane protein